MILIINICKEKLHYFEFVKPIEDILRDNGFPFTTRHYFELNEKDINASDKIIICGTSLKDFDYFNHLDKFGWIKSFEKPALGICAGMQIITNVFGGEIRADDKKIKNIKEIGMIPIKFKKEFLGLNQKIEVYSLHQLGVRKVEKEFEVFALSNKGIQAVKHKTKKVYGVLFHPEVRNKNLIIEFCKI